MTVASQRVQWCLLRRSITVGVQVWTHAASVSRPVKIVEGSAGRSVSGGVLLAKVRLTDSTVCCMNSCGWWWGSPEQLTSLDRIWWWYSAIKAAQLCTNVIQMVSTYVGRTSRQHREI